ncbi:hypothetical protein [Algiphilus sp.]|uniref:hypothetical protein n=1 Tax=Algiphilus sp. TaxID=1872431 RepID=UPI0025C713E8|nr:hypothetical protein [Algiphilus sp.]MCK5772046.1 hypothetical protein [Algiphilus sp.]
MSVTFSTKRSVDTFRRKIDIEIPEAGISGSLEVDYKVKSKPEIADLQERGLTDEEYLPEIVAAIHGLGDPETDEPLTGQAAIDEVLHGRFSMWLTPRISQEYFAAYNETRKGNSRRRR